jgi:hypothetical protein
MSLLPNKGLKPLALLFILFGGVLRFAYLDTIRHNIDHAYPIWQALTTLETGSFPLIGQSTSVLFANPALTGTLYLPVLALTRSPLAVYVFVILLNTAAIYFAYRASFTLTKDERLALFAAGLMAVNPWVIEYSRTTWVQSLMPFFMCGVAYLLFPVLLGEGKNSVPRLISALVLATLFTQTYLLAFFIVAPIALLLLIFRRRVPLNGVLIGGLVFALATGIYVFGLFRGGDGAFQRTDNFTSASARLNDEAFSHAVRLVTGSGYIMSRSANIPNMELWNTLEQIVHYSLFALLLIGIGRAVWMIAKRDSHPDAAIIALVWWGLPILAMSYTGNPVHPFYQLLGLPAGFVLIAWGADTLFSRVNFRTPLFAAVWIGVAVVSFVAISRGAQSIEQSAGRERVLGLPLHTTLAIGEAINTHRPEGGVVFANLNGWTLNSAAGRLFTVIDDTRVPLVSIIPESGGLYIVAANPENPLALPPFSEAVETLTLTDGTTITVNRFTEADLSEVGAQLQMPTQEGLTLYGYELRQRETLWTLITYWRVDEVLPETVSYAFGTFAHLYDEGGERIAIVDGEVVPGYLWQVGDVHIHRMQFEAETPFEIHLGQYDAFANRTIQFRGEPPILPGEEIRRRSASGS